ncbi:MAG: D-alanine--D-alanine ligase [Clostridia bacterium]|nr:D-alanine--D-alanine ligase [Clostridia bacterium]
MSITLGILYGSRTCEHDVSVISAAQAAQAARKAGFNAVKIYIARDGDWYIGSELENIAFHKDFQADKVTQVLPAGEGGKMLLLRYPTEKRTLFGASKEVLERIDVVMPVMHGMNGEDGTVAGMLDLMDVPYTSSGLVASSVGMDKIAMKQFFRGCGFPVVEDLWVDRGDWRGDRDGCIERIEAKLRYPVFVKPANLGSSIGIGKAKDRDGLIHAMDVAASFDRRILIERGIEQLKEINCGVLGYGSEAAASALEMPVSVDDFLTYKEKYLQGQGSKGNGSAQGAKTAAGAQGSKGMASLARRIPAPISEEKTREVQALAVNIFRALDCKGVVRIDFMLEGDEEKLYVGEINTIPGSLAFYLFEHIGTSFPDLIEKMVEYAYRAYADRHESVFTYDSTILDQQSGGVKHK